MWLMDDCGNSCIFVSGGKKSLPSWALFGCVEPMFQFDCDLLYLLQLWGGNDFNGLYFKLFHIFKPTMGIIEQYMAAPHQRSITLNHVDTMKPNILNISSAVTTFAPVTRAKARHVVFTYKLQENSCCFSCLEQICLKCLQQQRKWNHFTSAVNRYFSDLPQQ